MPEETHIPPFAMMVAAGVVIFALGVYAGATYQKTQTEETSAEDAALIAVLQEEVGRLATESAQAPKPLPTGLPTPLPPVSVFAEYYLPASGTRLCRDTIMEITWKADTSRADQVRVILDTPMVPTAPLVDAPVTWNERGAKGEGYVEWKVGTGIVGTSEYPLPDGDLYRMRYEAWQYGKMIEKKESGLFAIQTCQG